MEFELIRTRLDLCLPKQQGPLSSCTTGLTSGHPARETSEAKIGEFELKQLDVESFWLTRPKSLWFTFFWTVLLTVCFPIVASQWQLVFLDALSSPAEVRTQLMAFSATQKTVHAWSTGTLDVAYPFAYGLLFAGTALRFFKRLGPYLALPGFLAIPVDLAEGVVQVLALTDTADLLTAKAWLTPLKLLLFTGGLAIALFAWFRCLVAHIRALVARTSTRNAN